MGKIYEKEVKHYSGMPAASLTLGIISILTINSKLGKAGMVLGIIGVSLCCFIYLWFIFAILMQ